MICPNCGKGTMIWESDYTFDDFEMGGEGIVSVWQCMECGTWINVFIPIPEEKKDED